jgi:SOUL heme-binding protein
MTTAEILNMDYNYMLPLTVLRYTKYMNSTYIIIGILLLFILWSVGSYLVVKNIEKPVYKVVAERDGYEIREYQSYIVAETQVTGTRPEALGEGFRVIADYIFGNNVSRSSIAMTSPVLETSQSEKISMTTPVLSNETSENERTIAFVLPSAYTLESLPVPNNPKVTLREVPAHRVAALSFTWYATPKRVEAKKALLVSYLNRDQVNSIGDTQVAQYNPPLSMPLILKNEILIPVEN